MTNDKGGNGGDDRDDEADEVSPEEDAAIRAMFRSPPVDPPRLRVVEGQRSADDATDEAWLLARAKGEPTEHPDPARAASYQRLEGALSRLPPPPAPPDYQANVLAQIDLADAEAKHKRAATRLGQVGGWLLAVGLPVAFGAHFLAARWVAVAGLALAVAGLTSLVMAYAHDRLATRARNLLAERERAAQRRLGGKDTGSPGAG